MKLYIGHFKDINDKDVTVDIGPTSGEADGTVDLRFIMDEPVVIEQVAEAIFTPVKTKSCTINIFTDEIYWELYTGFPTGIYVHVYDEDQSLFDGYLTPCIYSQDYAWKGQLTLEAIDYLAVLDSIKYEYIPNGTGIATIDAILENMFSKIPEYSSYTNSSPIDFTLYQLQEGNFFEDGDAISCKEVINEICLFLGLSVFMYDGTICFYDYSNPTTTAEILDKALYGPDMPIVELDDIYSKINISCSLNEVDDDELVYDMFDDSYINRIYNGMRYFPNLTQYYGKYGYSWRQSNHHTQSKNSSRIWVKPYYFVDDDFANSPTYNPGGQYKVGKWKTHFYNLDTNQDYPNQTIAQKFYSDNHVVQTTENGVTSYTFFPEFKAVYPISMFADTYADVTPTKIEWKNYLLFTNYNFTYWQNYIKNKTLDNDGLQKPVLEYTSDKVMTYSIDGGISWITFKGDLWYQICIEDKINPQQSTDSGDVIYYPFPFDGISLNTDVTDDNKLMRSRKASFESNANIMNSGWDLLKVKLQIGDKYFQGFEWSTTEHKYVTKGWSTTEATFYIPYHDESVSTTDSGATENIHYYKWLKPVTNTDYTDKVGEDDCFAIPIMPEDKVSGALKITLHTPKVMNNLVSDDDAKSFAGGNPNMWMKELEIGYTYTDDTHWAADTLVNDDIVYEQIVNPDYSNEMDDIELKINSWYQNKPTSLSYILDIDSKPVKNIGDQPQEANLIDKYYAHYKTPKRIFEINYKITDLDPRQRYKHKTPQDTEYTTYAVNSYSTDVRQGLTKLKLIEV